MVDVKAKFRAQSRIRARGERGQFTSIEQMKNIAESEGITDERVMRTLRNHRDRANKLAKLS